MSGLCKALFMLKTVAFAIGMGLLTITTGQAQTFTTAAKQALIMDYNSGTILYQKNADERIPPASLAKLMAMEVVFHQLKSGSHTMEDKFLVSEDAWRRGGANSGGSSMFAKLNSDIELGNLIRGVIIQSGNDAAIAIAEGLAGSEAGFAGLMNQRARAIGLRNSNFVNSTGLPAEDQYVTMRDLGKLASHLIRTYPEYYPIYSEEEFTWGRIRQTNRNPLLGKVDGADGLKTGYTDASGYALVGSAKQDDRRLIIAMSGLKSKRQRSTEAIKMMRWGFRAFRAVDLFKEGEVVGEAPVYGGEKSGVALTANGPLTVFVPIGFRDRLKMEIVFDGPLMPPVETGSQIARLEVSVDGKVSQETPLFAAETVEQGGVTARAMDAFGEVVASWFRF